MLTRGIGLGISSGVVILGAKRADAKYPEKTIANFTRRSRKIFLNV
ncbi:MULTISPECIES: hypothetical protein [unclassified Gemella]|nr:MULTISPECIES: hypothetical protein [unclassified Gemella]